MLTFSQDWLQLKPNWDHACFMYMYSVYSNRLPFQQLVLPSSSSIQNKKTPFFKGVIVSKCRLYMPGYRSRLRCTYHNQVFPSSSCQQHFMLHRFEMQYRSSIPSEVTTIPTQAGSSRCPTSRATSVTVVHTDGCSSSTMLHTNVCILSGIFPIHFVCRPKCRA